MIIFIFYFFFQKKIYCAVEEMDLVKVMGEVMGAIIILWGGVG